MRLSFTESRPKSFLELNTKIWIAVTASAVVFMIVFDLFIANKIDDMVAKKTVVEQERAEFAKSIDATNKTLELLAQEKESGSSALSSNTALKESLINLFALVPDQITLNSIELHSDMLVLKGITPSKDIYTFLLSVPLKSVFSESEVSFYQTSDSWYNFVSVNKLKEQNVE